MDRQSDALPKASVWRRTAKALSLSSPVRLFLSVTRVPLDKTLLLLFSWPQNQTGFIQKSNQRWLRPWNGHSSTEAIPVPRQKLCPAELLWGTSCFMDVSSEFEYFSSHAGETCCGVTGPSCSRPSIAPSWEQPCPAVPLPLERPCKHLKLEVSMALHWMATETKMSCTERVGAQLLLSWL